MSDTYIRTSLRSFYDSAEMPGGYWFNQPDTIKLIDLYYNSKFKSGQYDDQGFRKFFYNIVKPACDIATKFIDLDTKDIILIPERADDELRVWVMQRRLKQWLKDENFGALLNQIGFDLPKYGTIVLKKTKKSFVKVNIQNIRNDVRAESLNASDFVYELITMSRGEIQKMKWDKDAVAELLSSDEETFIIYDCYHKSGDKWQHYIKSDLFSYRKGDAIVRSTEAEINDKVDYLPAITLLEDEVDELPYRELHWEKVPGRWLGYGFVEYLEDNQVAVNEAENLERKGLAFKALQIWQTRDDSAGGSNILTGAKNGDILKIDSELTPVQKDNSDLSAFNNTRSNWTSNTERKTFTSDITTGASLPSRTPLGVANLQASLASSYFELKRENFGIFVKNLCLDDILPSFLKNTSKEHEFVFLGSDSELEKFDRAVTEALVAEAVQAYAERTGFFPSKEQRLDAEKRVREQLKKRDNRYLKLPKDFFRDARFVVDVLITGENVDNGTRSQVIQLVLQIVGTNPGVLQNKVAKSLLFQLLALGGISPAEINAVNMEDEMPMQVAGSVSAPTPVQGMAPVTSSV